MSEDAERIKALGGPARLAELLGYDKTDGGVQRVHNWTTRGIPSKVKLGRPDLFLVPLNEVPGVLERLAAELPNQLFAASVLDASARP